MLKDINTGYHIPLKVTENSFSSALRSDVPTETPGKKYYLDEIENLQTSYILPHSIIVIIHNLEKELIANLPSEVLENISEKKQKIKTSEKYSRQFDKKLSSDHQYNFPTNSYGRSPENSFSSALRSDEKMNKDNESLLKWEKVKISEIKTTGFSNMKMNCSLSRSDGDINKFKPTEKIKTDNDFDKIVKDIRILLNKLSVSNYATQSVLVINIIEEYFKGAPEKNLTLEDHEKLSVTVLNILSINTFLSGLYSKLYLELMSKFSIFEKTLNVFIDEFNLKTDEEVNYIDPDKDYDGYCKYIKNNDNRKANTLFIVNLIKFMDSRGRNQPAVTCERPMEFAGKLDKSRIVSILEHFLMKSIEYIDIENKINEVEEITDNVFIIISNIYSIVSKTEKWKTDIFPKITQISKMKNKEHSSISSRILFKYMDIMKFISDFE
jgi:hypothetical protein